MKKNWFYLVSSCLLSSFFTLGIYKIYYENKITPISYKRDSKENVSAVKLISHENYASLLSSAGLPDFVVPAERAVNAVVHVKNYSNQVYQRQELPFDPFDFFFGFPNDPRRRQNPSPSPKKKEKSSIQRGYGSGVIISNDGYIITNNHVIESADKIMITLNDQTTYQAEIIGTDLATDIALLKIKVKNKKLDYLLFADSDEVKVGEWVLAIGNPMSLNSTVTAGIISAKNRNLGILSATSENIPPIESFIQTDAAINPGNSGGALINIKGELIGINTAISSKSGRNEGYGFAIPSNIAKKVVKDIEMYGSAKRAFLGILVIDLSNEEIVENYKSKNKDIKIEPQQGILIDNFSEKSAAKAAGLRKHDIIKQIDGTPIRNYAELSSVIASKRPGDKVKVKILRKKEYLIKEVELKSSEGSTKIKTKDQMSALELLGVELKVLDDSDKKEFNISYGLKVITIQKGGLLSKISFLEKEDIIQSINGINLSKIADLETALKRKSKKLESINFIKEENGQKVSLNFGEKGLN